MQGPQDIQNMDKVIYIFNILKLNLKSSHHLVSQVLSHLYQYTEPTHPCATTTQFDENFLSLILKYEKCLCGSPK